MDSMATAPTWPLGSQKWLLTVCSKCLKLGRGRVKLKSLTAYAEQVRTTLLCCPTRTRPYRRNVRAEMVFELRNRRMQFWEARNLGQEIPTES